MTTTTDSQPVSLPALPSDSTRGVLLMAHGARDPAWAKPFEAIANRLRSRDAALHVALGFLEFMAPTIVDAGAALAQAGCTKVDLVPLFLGAGGHVRKDIPVFFERLKTTYPDVSWRLQPAIGEVGPVVDAMAEATLVMLDTP